MLTWHAQTFSTKADIMASHLQLPTINVLIGILIAYSCNFLVTAGVYISKTLQPQKDFAEVINRIKTFWIIVVLLSLSLMVTSTVAIIFWAMISYLALKEYFTIIPTRPIDRRVLFWAYVSIPIQYYWISKDWYNMFTIFIPVFVFLFLPLRMVTLGETKGFLRAAGTLHWGVMMMVYCMSYLAAFYMIEPEQNPAGGAQGYILYLLFLNQLNDAAQYFWGKKLGKRKIIPQISPNKTVEGLLGGMGTTLFFAILLGPYLTPLRLFDAAIVGILISFSGFIGDIIMSALKRDLRIKDTGQLLPGHGGVLDRIDSLLFTAPLYFHFIRYLTH